MQISTRPLYAKEYENVLETGLPEQAGDLTGDDIDSRSSHESTDGRSRDELH